MVKTTGLHTKLGAGFEHFIRRTVEKKSRKYQAGNPQVVISKEGDRFKAEIKCAYQKKSLFVSEVGKDAKRVFIRAMKKLGSQLRRTHEKTRDHSGRSHKEEIMANA